MRTVLLALILAGCARAPARSTLAPQVVAMPHVVEVVLHDVQVDGVRYECTFEVWSNGTLTLPRPVEPAVVACVAAFEEWRRQRGGP